jgi:phosphoribosylanthranilate isomerase
MRTRVKFCGLTRDDDVRAAVDLGVDAIGLVFHPTSPRAVDIDQAARLAALVPAFVTLVGLFVDAPAERIRAVLRRVPLGAIQFHGRERSPDCARFERPWIKALAMRDGLDLARAAADYQGAASLLLDTYDPTLAGGTGRRFDWERVPPALAPQIILAGGLDPGNVADAIRQVRPHAVDVSGGVEAAKGVKDHSKMADFMQGVRDGDQTR